MAPFFALAAAVAFLPALVVSTPAPKATTTATQHWSRNIHARLERERDGFTDANGVVHLPLYKRQNPRSRPLRKRGDIRQLGLGDLDDVSYQISLTIGGSQGVFRFDTGSSDLLFVATNCSSSQCTQGAGSHVPAYDLAKDTSANRTGVPVEFDYGTSNDFTYAKGWIIQTAVDLAGWNVKNQAFGAIDDTNTTDSITSYQGIFGGSFPYSSVIVNNLFNTSLRSNVALSSASPQAQAQAYLASIATTGPLLARLALDGRLMEPGLGGLPSGISNDSITYTPIFRYPPYNVTGFDYDFVEYLPDLPGQMEVPIDGVKVNGQLVSTPSTPLYQGRTYAWIDSGTYDIVAPQVFVDLAHRHVGYDPTTKSIPCDAKLMVSVVIGGKDFPINPMDWIGGSIPDEPSNGPYRCTLNLEAGAPPSTISSWLLGDVFMRNVLAYFYLGSPDQSDPAKIGFLSTTDADAAGARFDSVLPSSLSGGYATRPFSTLSTPAPSVTTSLANPVGDVNVTAISRGSATSATGTSSVRVFAGASKSGSGSAAPSASQTTKSAGVAMKGTASALVTTGVALFTVLLTA